MSYKSRRTHTQTRNDKSSLFDNLAEHFDDIVKDELTAAVGALAPFIAADHARC